MQNNLAGALKSGHRMTGSDLLTPGGGETP